MDISNANHLKRNKQQTKYLKNKMKSSIKVKAKQTCLIFKWCFELKRSGIASSLIIRYKFKSCSYHLSI